MKHLVRNRATQAYLCADGGWSENVSVAVRFEDTMSMLTEILTLGVVDKTNLEMVLMIGEEPSSLDVVLPLFPAITVAELDSKKAVSGDKLQS